MGIMSWLAKWFGQVGRISFTGTTKDGRTFDGKVDIEAFNVSNKEVESKLKDALFVEYGVEVKSVTVTGFYPT